MKKILRNFEKKGLICGPFLIAAQSLYIEEKRIREKNREKRENRPGGCQVAQPGGSVRRIQEGRNG